MEKKAYQVELYGVARNINEVFDNNFIFKLTESKTGEEWQVAAHSDCLLTDLTEGKHIFIKGNVTVLCKNGIIANFIDQWGRICSHCGKHHEDGYYSENTGLYACSEDCLNKLYTQEEIEEERENEWLFWTEWE